MGVLQFISNIAWPAIFLLGGWYFRSETRAAFIRLKEVGPGGLKLDGPAAVQQQSASERPSNALIVGIKQFISAEQLEPAAAQVREQLASQTKDKDEQLDVLIHSVASLSIQLGHERNYNLIFGSQLAALVRMNEATGAREDVIRALYDEAAIKYPELYKKYTFDEWLQFLTTASGLASRNGELLQTTPFGRGFLRYLVDRRMIVSRPY
jgi:hypothetical protein